eukprot:2414107-Rhodomonas_salina.2
MCCVFVLHSCIACLASPPSSPLATRLQQGSAGCCVWKEGTVGGTWGPDRTWTHPHSPESLSRTRGFQQRFDGRASGWRNNTRAERRGAGGENKAWVWRGGGRAYAAEVRVHAHKVLGRHIPRLDHRHLEVNRQHDEGCAQTRQTQEVENDERCDRHDGTTRGLQDVLSGRCDCDEEEEGGRVPRGTPQQAAGCFRSLLPEPGTALP